MHTHDPRRREFLQRAGLAGAGAVLLLAGCGGDDKAAARRPDAAVGSAEGVPTCDDLDGLTVAEVQVRETFEYVETAPAADLACDLCEFYTQPTAGQACGGCTLFAGPVNPRGTCNSFSAA